MTDQLATTAPAEAAKTSAPSPTDPAQNGSAANGSAGWFTGLQDEANRNLVQAKGWDKLESPEPILTSYRELEAFRGRAIIPPKDDSPPEEMDRFYKAVGRPDAPDGYKFKMPGELPPEMPYDDLSATKFKSWSHQAGLNSRQASLLHDAYIKDRLDDLKQVRERTQQQVGEAHQAIVKKWGPPESETYKRNLELAKRAVRKQGLTESLKARGILDDKGNITDAGFAFHFASVGQGLYAEDNIHGEPGALTESNPWKAGQENLTEQGRITRRDPALAEALIRAAGKDPAKELYRPKGR